MLFKCHHGQDLKKNPRPFRVLLLRKVVQKLVEADFVLSYHRQRNGAAYDVGTKYYFTFFVSDQGTLYGKNCRRNFKKGSFDWKLNRLVPLLIVESDWMATNPLPTPTLFPNTSNQNFQLTVLFNVVERSGNHVFEDDNSPSEGVHRIGNHKVFIESVVVETSKRNCSIGYWNH